MTDELQFRPLEWPKAWVDALLERKRQVEVKHFDDKNDDAYPDGEMEAAA
jgi:hypothetical protein